MTTLDAYFSGFFFIKRGQVEVVNSAAEFVSLVNKHIEQTASIFPCLRKKL